MSTHATIARPASAGSYADGVYLHSDGYIAWTGRVLHAMCREHFNGDGEQMARYLIDEHRAGWSSIGGDAAQPTTWIGAAGRRRFDDVAGAEAARERARNISYQERPGMVLEPAIDEAGEYNAWVYIIHPEALEVRYQGAVVATASFDLPAPAEMWDALQAQVYA